MKSSKFFILMGLILLIGCSINLYFKFSSFSLFDIKTKKQFKFYENERNFYLPNLKLKKIWVLYNITRPVIYTITFDVETYEKRVNYYPILVTKEVFFKFHNWIQGILKKRNNYKKTMERWKKRNELQEKIIDKEKYNWDGG